MSFCIIYRYEVRLNSPRGEFKISNMGEDEVDLCPEDISCASCIEEEIEKLAVAQLNKVLVKMLPYKSKW